MDEPVGRQAVSAERDHGFDGFFRARVEQAVEGREGDVADGVEAHAQEVAAVHPTTFIDAQLDVGGDREFGKNGVLEPEKIDLG